MNNKLVLGIVIGLGLGLGLAALFFWQRSKTSIAVGRLPMPGATPPASYTNEETTDITWNEEGLPIRIIVHRKALRE